MYPLIADEVSEDMADHAEDEHADAKKLIAQVRSSQNDDDLIPLMGRLQAAIQEHVHEEESEMLPEVRRQLGEADLEELGEQFDDAKDDAGA